MFPVHRDGHAAFIAVDEIAYGSGRCVRLPVIDERDAGPFEGGDLGIDDELRHGDIWQNVVAVAERSSLRIVCASIDLCIRQNGHCAFVPFDDIADRSRREMFLTVVCEHAVPYQLGDLGIDDELRRCDVRQHIVAVA